MRAFLIIVLAFLITPANAADVPVTKPGSVLFDADARLVELRAMHSDRRIRFCRAAIQSKNHNPAPIRELVGVNGYGGNDKRTMSFEHLTMRLAADAFGTGSARAMKELRAVLLDWAGADAMAVQRASPDGRNTSVLYGLKRALNGLIPAWAVVRNDPAFKPDERALIDQWIGRLRTAIDVNTGGKTRTTKAWDCANNANSSTCNNHRYLRDMANMAWGALTHDSVAFNKGIERYRIALRQMRADGSLPLETARGARAIWYQRHAIASLVMMAEMAAVQGHDLYGETSDAGVSLHTAIRFLLDAVDKPEIVFDYASLNRSPGPAGKDWTRQDLGFLRARGRFATMAWMEAYIRRFPDHDNSRRLRDLVYNGGHPLDDRPLVDPLSGGNATCWFAVK